jgi:hypothetical protein
VSKTHPTRHLLLVVGLGLAAAAALLLWVCLNAPAMRAAEKVPVAASPTLQDGVWASWASTTPTSTTVTKAYKQWPIEEYGITVTFPANALGSTLTAVFTFTPKTGHADPPTSLSSYFFDLRGIYSSTGGNVSMNNEYYIALEYDPSELGGAEERSLQFYSYDIFGEQWEPEMIAIDVGRDTITCTTLQTGLFCLAGYGDQIFLPIVQRSD